MNDRLSKPIESLLEDTPPETVGDPIDVVIVGSGYGGSIAAARLAGDGRRVIVLERGREYALGDFPVGLGEVPGHVRFQRADADETVGYADGLFDFRIGRDMDVLVGNGLGGTSLINANVAARPAADEFRYTEWPREIRADQPTLDTCFDAVTKLLGVATSPATAKYRALSVLSRAVGADTCQLAPITVTFGPDHTARENAVGIKQSPCTMCGNCVTGCNVGAKNTLMMNALPLAITRGAELYTGATVLSVMPSASADHPWILRLRRTASEKTALRDEVFYLAARDVILAAGTLGSTEILMRSREAHGLLMSGRLGDRFSGNGDAVAFGFAQAQSVEAIGRPTQEGGPYAVGPTIVGIARATVEDPQGTRRTLTIEDGAVPTSLRRAFGEAVTTGALFHRLGNGDLPAWYADAGTQAPDPITVASGAMDHSQILLLMGDDGAAGHLSLKSPSNGLDATKLDRAHLVVEWPKVGDSPVLMAADKMLAKEDRARGFDGGQYVPNPLWRLLPADATFVMSGPAPGGRAITVHPLGGCGMGDSVDTGVVNHAGQVFKAVPGGPGTEVHDGLHVLDGSIIPRALGINPFLTIAALSWRAADLLRRSRGWQESARSKAEGHADLGVTPSSSVPAPSEAVAVLLREQLIGTVTSVPEWLRAMHPGDLDNPGDCSQGTRRWRDDRGLILQVEMDIQDLEGWLERGTREALPTTAKVYFNPLPPEMTKTAHLDHMPEEHLPPECLVASGTGTVRLLVPDEIGYFERRRRAILALWAYVQRRQSFGQWLERKWSQKPSDDRAKPKGGWLGEISGFWNVALQHALYRRLQYELRFTIGEAGHPQRSFTFSGEKLLAWRVDAPRLWDALLNLPFTLRGRSGDPPVEGSLGVDMQYLASTGAPQAKKSPHLPATVMGLSAIGMLFARALLQTQFWEFGAPDYPDKPVPRPQGSPPLNVRERLVQPETFDVLVPLSEDKHDVSVRLRLTRYRQPDGKAEPVLLIHGLAQGSLIYSTDTLDRNMAAAMWEAGYDVWLIDYRISNMLPEPVPDGDWTMDEIAQYDMPAAVGYVHTATGGRAVRIFAHCVGATSIAMSILAGWLDSKQIACVAFNAIHPWTMPSAVNGFKARLGSFFRDVLRRDLLDPVPAPNPSVAQVLLDRIAFSIARYDDEPDSHTRSGETSLAEAVCDRMTLLYARMWRHANLDPRTHAAFPMLVGPAPGDVYRQLYYFALRQRLTDHEGMNRFLTDANLEKNWTMPTFFFHGEESRVFNPQSATRSAVRLDGVINRLDRPNRPARNIPIRLLRVPGFGHMDVVFAKDAHKHVYGVLQDFFAAPWDGAPEVTGKQDPHRYIGIGLTAGPVLRAAWITPGQTEVNVRIWAETDDEVTTSVDGLEVTGRELVVGDQWPVDGRELRYRVVDLRLPGQGPVDVIVKAATHGSRIWTGLATKSMRRMFFRTERDEPADAQPAESKRQEKAAPPEESHGYPVTYPDTHPWLARLRAAAASGEPCDDMRFLVGSCRYPGTPFEREASDLVFAGMRRHVDESTETLPGVHLLFLIGDQIYADATANILDTEAWRERYGQRYRTAFTSEHERYVLAHIPTHFAIDDHEISDNWSGETAPPPHDQDVQRRADEFKQAKKSAKLFQSSGRETHQIGGDQPSAALWYPLADKLEHCCPAFVMDTRSERKPRLSATGRAAQFVSSEQLGALRAWLTEANRDRRAQMPKFIFCGVGIAPISREYALFPETWRSQDWWLGYPDALAEVAGVIVDQQIRHVVFVSGDLHLSSVSRLTLAHGGASVTAWQVVSSGLYSPLPFANARPVDYDWNRPIKTTVGPIGIEAESGILCSGPPHFLRVDAQKSGAGWSLSVAVAGSSGAFIPPAGAPPSGFVATGSIWTADLS